MNEEKEAIELLKQEPDFSLSYYKREKAIDIVLNLVDKQQKEIEELYEVLEEWINGERYNDIFYISKNKIKEKIEKIKEDEEFYREQDRMYEFDGKINLLKELLGEEK